MGKNSKSRQKKLKIAEKKASRPKQVHIGYRNKSRKVEDTEKGGNDKKKIQTIKKRWISSIWFEKIHVYWAYSIRITANPMLK